MKEIRKLIKDVAVKFSLPTSKEDAISKSQEKYLWMDFASSYGGYRLVMVDVSSGGHYGAFNQSSCCRRMSKKEMVAYLNGLLNS
jgi:hypothetical protein